MLETDVIVMRFLEFGASLREEIEVALILSARGLRHKSGTKDYLGHAVLTIDWVQMTV